MVARGVPTYLHGLIQLRLGALFLPSMQSHNLSCLRMIGWERLYKS